MSVCIPNAPDAQCVEPAVDPVPVRVDARALVDSQLSFDPAHPADQPPYVQLFAADCQCQAANVSPKAHLIELERNLAAALADCAMPKRTCAVLLQKDLLHLRQLERRNEAAAAALEAYYLLASAEGRGQKLDSSIELLDQAIERANRLHQQDLLGNVDRTELRRQKLAVLDKKGKLLVARKQLNAQLRAMLGCDPATPLNYWPEVSWAVTPLPLDEAAATAIALQQRSDLRSLRMVLSRLDTSTLPVARAVLSVADPSLGTAQAADTWLGTLTCRDADCQEMFVRRAQLRHLIDAQRRAVTAEVRAAVAQVEATTSEVLIAQQTSTSWRQRLAELNRMRDINQATVFDSSEAQLQLLATEADLIDKTAQLYQARAALRAVQGVLASECGF